MCGICGIVYQEAGRVVDRAALVHMRDAMYHRGPDGAGIFTRGGVGLGHRRLSVIDLADGHQPMCNEDETVWIVYNGEIYNYRELRRFLVQKGHIFKTNSDTETIIHLYEEFGEECVTKLNGMFAFAVWDQKTRRLMLARDRMGIKPLYYWEGNGVLLFASEIKSLLTSRMVAPSLDAEVLPEYLMFRYVSGARTLFRGIKSLQPGHVLTWSDGSVRMTQYWTMRCDQGPGGIDDEHVDELDALLEDSVRLRLISDVPVGTYCSGGVDSSLITAYACKEYKGALNTFSIGFNEKEFDERRYARMVASHCGTEHHELVVDEHTYGDLWPKAVWLLEAPLSHAHSVQLFLLSQMAKSRVTVMLTGEGSDELFGGYPRYKLLIGRLGLTKVPEMMLSGIASCLRPFQQPRIQRLREALSEPLERVIALNARFLEEKALRDIGIDGACLGWETRRDLVNEAAAMGADPFGQLLYLDLKTYLVALLERQDRMSMGASIESRVPFLDYRIVKWSLGLHRHEKIRGFESKHIVKQLASRYLPEEVVYRRKSGFGVPLHLWLKNKNGLGRYVEILKGRKFKERGIWNAERIDRVVEEYCNGAKDHSELLWEIINVELWCQAYLDGMKQKTAMNM